MMDDLWDSIFSCCYNIKYIDYTRVFPHGFRNLQICIMLSVILFLFSYVLVHCLLQYQVLHFSFHYFDDGLDHGLLVS